MLQSKFDAQSVIDAGHPPVADRKVLVDWDGVITPFGMIFETTEPIEGVVESLNALKSAGYQIIIFTSRLSKAWHDSEGWDHEQATEEQLTYMQDFLLQHNIPYDGFTCEKIPAEAYFDDKAYRVEKGPRGLYDAVAQFMNERSGV